jgi:hypothetical protein
MRIVTRGATLVVVLMAVVSCSGLLKKTDADASAEAGAVDAVDAAPVPLPATLATNQGDITRYPDETVMTPTKLAFQRGFNVRESEPSGKIFATLPKGTLATQLSKHHAYYLILWDNTAAPGTQLMGWVHQDAFLLTIPDAGALACRAGQSPLMGDVPYCGKICASNADCAVNEACNGTANKLAAGNTAGDAVKVCTYFIMHDGGATPTPTVVDAGHSTVFDAGHATVDAGPGPSPVGDPAKDVVPALAGNKCPGSFVFVTKTGKCHRLCPKGPIGGECKNTPFFCIHCDTPVKQVCGESQLQCR